MALLRPLFGWLRGRGAGPAAGQGRRPRWEKHGARKIVWRRRGEPAVVDAVDSAPAVDGRVLGWLVVRRSPDPTRRGQLLSLGVSGTVLSRRSSREGAEHPGRVAFADEFMSGDHATVRWSARGFEVVERQGGAGGPPANGLFVNGRRLPASPGGAGVLADGDVLRLGATELVFKELRLSADEAGP